MNLETFSRPPEEIQGTIINVSFPRSGHRFLREILAGYFEDRFVFYESYTKDLISPAKRSCKLKDVNYVKTHDFDLAGSEILCFKFPNNRRYLVQIRHPLESITSYYEFSLKHWHIQKDSEDVWRVFLDRNLTYWKQFYDIWLSDKQPNSLLICYDDLYTDTLKVAELVIRFLTGKISVDSDLLVKVIKDQEFLQYIGDSESKKHHKRRLETFKYFNFVEFQQIESSLAEDYLQPRGIKLLFQ